MATKQFNLKIDERTYRDLARLARAADRSKAATIRVLIRDAVVREFSVAGSPKANRVGDQVDLSEGTQYEAQPA